MEGVLRRVLRRGSSMGFYSKKGVLRRVLRRGSEKGVSRCLERPLVGYAPLGVHPRIVGFDMYRVQLCSVLLFRTLLTFSSLNLWGFLGFPLFSLRSQCS